MVFLADFLITYLQGVMPEHADIIRRLLVISTLVLLVIFFLWPLGKKIDEIDGGPGEK